MEFKGTSGKWTIYLDKFKKLNTGLFSVPIISKYGSEFNYGYYNAHCFGRNEEQCKYNALLISKAPEMLEKLSEIVNILDIKCTDGCVNKTWGDFQNGNGEDVGLEIDKFIKDTEQLIKEATEL